MRNLFGFFLLISCFNAFACSDFLKSYDLECKAQDRYLKISNEFKTYAITTTNLKEFIIPKAIGKASYFADKNDFLNHSGVTLAQDEKWQAWNKGQKIIKNFNPVYLELSDILKLHKIFSSTDSGKLRSRSGITNPKITLNCSDKILDENVLNTILDYDLTSAEGYPLLKLSNIKLCEDKKFNVADLYYYKGASVQSELTRWLMDLNDMFDRYENENAPNSLSPYQYLSDMRRWFLALRPFDAENEAVINSLMDYATKRLQLPSLSFADYTNPIFITPVENQDITIKNLQESLNFFESCLFERKTNLISAGCESVR
jgi:hypothetical protein